MAPIRRALNFSFPILVPPISAGGVVEGCWGSLLDGGFANKDLAPKGPIDPNLALPEQFLLSA